MLPYMSFWPQPNGTELGGGCFGEAFSFNHPKQTLREDFGTLRADYNRSDRDTLSAAYTVDDGYGLIPLADPLFASALSLRSQVISVAGDAWLFAAFAQYPYSRVLARQFCQ